MKLFSSLLLQTLAILPAVYARKAVLTKKSSLLIPSDDPFYDVPSDIDGVDPGTILNHRAPPSPIGAFGVAPSNLKESYQLLYGTTDNVGNRTATVVTVLIPNDADFGKVLSYQIAEDAASIDCAPSFGFQIESLYDPKIGSNTTQLQLLLVEAALDQGWVVIVPDFEGPKGAYGSGKLAAHATLDGIRAVLDSKSITGVEEDARVTLWGYSGGGSVTKGAVELQAQYAPELNIAGAAFGGIGTKASDPVSLNEQRIAGFIVVALVGIANQYPAIESLINEHLKPEYKEKFYSPLHQCLEANVATFAYDNILDMFDNWRKVFYNSTFLEIVQEGTAAGPIPQVPIYWYQCVNDEVASISVIDSDVRKYCAGGAKVDFVKDTAHNVTHTSHGIIAAPQALAWLEGIMNGTIVETGCTDTDITTSQLDPNFVDLFPKEIQTLLYQQFESAEAKT